MRSCLIAREDLFPGYSRSCTHGGRGEEKPFIIFLALVIIITEERRVKLICFSLSNSPQGVRAFKKPPLPAKLGDIRLVGEKTKDGVCIG